MPKLYWCCSGCGAVDPVEPDDAPPSSSLFEEGDTDNCVQCCGHRTCRATLLDSPDDFIGG